MRLCNVGSEGVLTEILQQSMHACLNTRSSILSVCVCVFCALQGPGYGSQ